MQVHQELRVQAEVVELAEVVVHPLPTELPEVVVHQEQAEVVGQVE